MRNLRVVLCLAVVPLASLAAEQWNFTDRISVSDSSSGVFHHLDGAGRKHIAVSADRVTVVWEDNRSSDPQVYLSFKPFKQLKFSPPQQLSNGLEAFEPSITALAGGQFAMAWEQDSAIYLNMLEKSGQLLAEPLKLSSAMASHVSLCSLENQLFAVWREQENSQWSLWVARLEVKNGLSRVVTRNRLESRALKIPVLFPTIAASPAGISVAWEDRRHGNTRLYFSHSNDGGNTFSQPEYLNEFQSGRNEYDKGSGVTRVSMHSFAEDEVLAAWMDKRRSNTGYGIYASIGSDGGESFGPNERVHGKKGDKQPHSNPATAGNLAGDFVIAWDDFRSGDSDIWLSNYDEHGEWSVNFSPAVASGPGEQTHASIALDNSGGLHLLWIEREDVFSLSSLWYSYSPARQ